VSKPDHFSPVARQYAEFRPTYPTTLFDWLASITPQHGLAWDCGAGSGQASVPLAARYERVLATDLSAAQLAAAPALENVEYRAASAEDSGLPDGSCDLVIVAQALHWFDLDTFYGEVRRVLKPDGVLAVWGYNRLMLEHLAVQQALDIFYEQTIGAYWPAERVHVENGYRDLPFPFARITPPAFALQATWRREQLLGYLRSWSAVGRFRAAHGYDPVVDLDTQIAPHWPDGLASQVSWPLFLHVGHIST
jgi:SAM-dependent methyltransferase